MARLRFKNFSDLEFLQGIDPRKHFHHLLREHAEYFSERDIDLAKLGSDEASARKLLEVFTNPGNGMPGELLEALYVLDDFAMESGHDQLHDEVERQGIELDGKFGSLSPAEFAIAIWRHHPEVVLACHERMLHRKVRNYQEFQGSDSKRLSLTRAKGRRRALAEVLGPWFESKGRSRACEIHVYEEDSEIKFQVTHGRPVRTEGSIAENLKRSRVAYRPQKHDSVVFNCDVGVLRVSAQTAAEKELYRRTFGEVIFGDADYFPAGDLYTLAPLRYGKDALQLVEGIDRVRLTEVWVTLDADIRFVQMSRGIDLIDSIERYGKPNLAEGEIVRATFSVKYPKGRARRLEIRPPNVAIYDRERDGTLAEAFLRANGFLKV